MNPRLFAMCAAMSVLTGCANPINRVTMEDYTERCGQAERAGNLEIAVEACRRAWINTRIGALGSDSESMALYNLGRVQRKALKFTDAEFSLKRSLELEEQLSGLESTKTGRRLAELSAVLAYARRSDEGVIYVERLIPIADGYQGPERKFVAGLFFAYAEDMSTKQKADLSARFDAAGTKLGFTRDQFRSP